MTRVLVTGAAGFVGGALAARLARDPLALDAPPGALLLADAHRPAPALEPTPALDGARWLTGDLADPAYVDALAAEAPDVVFHLASVPGGAAERDPALGSAVNLHGTLRLLEQLARRAAPGRPPVVVFTSTVAVYGAPLPAQGVDAATPARPLTSYGAHKLMTEVLLADLSRRGALDGRSLRLPGIVARPPQAGGHVSAFMSDLIHRLAAGQAYTCPVSADATCWWMSVGCCV
ncbi:MAG: NAD-dependent epimerase/dehydratase family protein, partial [Porticoccaceae bacterium]